MNAKVVPIRSLKKKRTVKPVNLDKVKYFTSTEIKSLRKYARDLSETGKLKDVRGWLVIDLMTCTGLRVSEVCDLKLSHLSIGHGRSEILIENGKRGVSGTVVIPLSLKKHLQEFLKWKQEQKEDVSKDAYLFTGQRGKWTSQAVQLVVKGYLKALNLYETGKSAHSLRHSYAVQLYAKEKDLRAVQKQLRHVSVQSTLIYADIVKEDIERQVRNLWN